MHMPQLYGLFHNCPDVTQGGVCTANQQSTVMPHNLKRDICPLRPRGLT
jgi:hypothetical protein